jgi:hypothetical protein
LEVRTDSHKGINESAGMTKRGNEKKRDGA